MRNASRGAHDQMGELSSSLQEVFVGVREVKANNTEPFEIKRFRDKLDDYFFFLMRSLHFGALAPAVIEVIAMSGIGFVLYIAGKEVLSGAMTPGQLTSFFAAILLAYQPLKRIITIYADIHYGLSAADRVFELMDRSFPTEKNRTRTLQFFSKKIVFTNVSFSYHRSKSVLKNINFTIGINFKFM